MTKEKKIKMAIAYKGISQAALAKAVDTTPSNFNQKLKRDTFTDEELEKIAQALGAEFRPCAFVFPDGMEI
jgi:transcriptional regulator with XRE-family HTH domain